MTPTQIAYLIHISLLTGCATQPMPQAYQPPPQPQPSEIPTINPDFLSTAVPMTAGRDTEQCKELVSRHIAFVMTTTTAIDDCMKGPSTSVACRAVPLWAATKDATVGGTDDEVMACAQQVDAAGIPFPEMFKRAVDRFVSAVERYKRKMGA